jgi:hypothetical protein
MITLIPSCAQGNQPNGESGRLGRSQLFLADDAPTQSCEQS